MTGAPAPALDGALVIDKPAGLTSHDVVSAVRRAAGTSRVGHIGTLDPMATGVLPLLLGRATRLAQFYGGATKTYEAHVRFGWATDTRDATGTPIGEPTEVVIDTSRLAAVLARFRGTFAQVPPAFSAKKVEGRRAYALARASAAVDLAAVDVTVHALDLVDVHGPDAILRVTASAGFYVRSLAHDLGVAVGAGAHLAGLRRLAAGSFTEQDAVSLDRLLADAAVVRERLVPIDALLPELPEVLLSDEQVVRARHGRDVPWDGGGAAGASPVAGPCRLVAPDGSIVAIAAQTTSPGVLHPSVVLI